MQLKIMGAILVISACGWIGWSMSATHKQEENALRHMITGLERMICELHYRLTPLPELCRVAAEGCAGPVRNALNALATELDHQIAPDVSSCMDAVILTTPKLTGSARRSLKELGDTLGRFDLEGQLRGLETVQQRCRDELERLGHDRDKRLRSYHTLGLCAGAALAILFL